MSDELDLSGTPPVPTELPAMAEPQPEAPNPIQPEPGFVADPMADAPDSEPEYDRVRLFKAIREELTEFVTLIRVLDGLSTDATILPYQHSVRRPLLRTCNIAAIDHVAKTLLTAFEFYLLQSPAKRKDP